MYMHKINKIIFVCGILILIGLSSHAQSKGQLNRDLNKNTISYTPENGFVPDEKTAIKIAEAIWLPIYGEKIYRKRPFTAKLRDGQIWVVEGSLNSQVLGGVPYAEIRKDDCKILKVIHTK